MKDFWVNDILRLIGVGVVSGGRKVFDVVVVAVEEVEVEEKRYRRRAKGRVLSV